MPGPHDIYVDHGQGHKPGLLPDLSSFFASPTALGAVIATDMFVLPRLMNKHKMLRAISTDMGRATFLNQTRAFSGGTSQAQVSKYLRGSTNKRFLRNTGMTIEAAYGSTAARRIGAGRLASTFSRFTLAFMVIEGAAMLGGMLGDAISAYQPSPYVNKRKQIETGGAFADTRYAQTQRMRAIQAIHNTQLSTRAALGNEASFMHLER